METLQEQLFTSIADLIFISKIEPNYVLNVSTKQLMPKGLLTSLYRTFITHNESRDRTFRFFKSVYHDAFTLLNELDHLSIQDPEARIVMSQIKEYIHRSCQGLLNHCKTYDEDKHHTSKIHALIEKINTMYNERYKQPF